MKKKIILGIIISILIIAAIIGGFFIFKLIQENNNKNLNNKTDVDKNEMDEKVIDIPTETPTIITSLIPESNEDTIPTPIASETKLQIEGKYSVSDQTEDYFDSKELNIIKKSDLTIDFDLNAVHGKDIESTNIGVGNVNGIATRLNENTEKYKELTDDMNGINEVYVFEEEIDGEIYKIYFIFTGYRQFLYATVVQDFAYNINPYAGNRVTFEETYEFQGK